MNKQLSQFVQDNGALFQELFGLPLVRFVHPLTGFDLVAFDSAMQVRLEGYEDGVSMRNALLVNKGDRAVKLVEDLIRADMSIERHPPYIRT